MIESFHRVVMFIGMYEELCGMTLNGCRKVFIEKLKGNGGR